MIRQLHYAENTLWFLTILLSVLNIYSGITNYLPHLALLLLLALEMALFIVWWWLASITKELDCED